MAPAALRPESRWSSTLVQMCVFAGVIWGAAWYARGRDAEQLAAQIETNVRLASIEKKLGTEVITFTVAERYAAAYRWENRGLGITVPDLTPYRPQAGQ